MPHFYPNETSTGRPRTLESVGLAEAVPPLRRGPDGRADVDYYLARARDERAKAAWHVFGAIGRALRRLVTGSVRSHQRPRHRTRRAMGGMRSPG